MMKLLEWKARPSRMPLLLNGARQVGKTYLLQEFGRTCFQDTIYINFETDSRLASEFSGDIDPHRLIGVLELYFNRKINPDSTLIILDEIQACERALTSLKYFCERAPQYPIVAAGSVLGVTVHRNQHSFPVGKVEMLTLYPMDFEEFLRALGQEALIEVIREAYANHAPLPGALHEKALELFKTYLVVGGMPGAVLAYLKDGRMLDALSVQSLILSSYVADMSKYASPAETTRILACFDSIPAQLAKENRKFQYKVVKKGGSATIFGPSIDWLVAAGVVLKCDRIEHPFIPLAAHRDLSAFKLYMADTGLLLCKSGVPASIMFSGWDNSTFSGAIAENYVAASLKAKGYPLYYWESKGTAEIDFILPRGEEVIPIEVKAGVHTKSRSLGVYRAQYKPDHVIRISHRNFGVENGIQAVPMYAVFCM